MFCNQCGTPLQPDYNLCPKCGQTVTRAIAPLATSHNPNRLQAHLKTLGIFWMIVGGIILLPALAVTVFGTAATMIVPFHDAMMHTVGPLLTLIIGGTLLVLGGGGLLVGWGLIQRRPWARIVAIILGVLALFHPVVGTALGIYTLWVLLSHDSENQYEQLSRTA